MGRWTKRALAIWKAERERREPSILVWVVCGLGGMRLSDGHKGRTHGRESALRAGVSMPSQTPPKLSPVFPGNRKRHRTRSHMVTVVSRARQVMSCLLSNLLGEPLKPCPPELRPYPAGTEMLARAPPLLAGPQSH